MKLSLRKIYTFLLVLGIFFFPFNSFEGVKQLGEFKTESGAYFLLLGFIILLVEWIAIKKIRIPYKDFIFQLLLIFMAWCILTVVFNLPGVYASYFKKTSGINRFIRQYFVLVLSAIVFFSLYWNVIVKLSTREVLLTFRRAFLYSFIAVSIYAFFEILYVIFGFYPAYTILRLFDFFPFTEYDFDISGRISSVCFEAPALGTFLITTAGWMFSYIITEKGNSKYTPAIIVMLLTYFSGSRTALVVVFLQLLVFLGIVLSRKQKVFAGLYLLGFVMLFSGFIVLSKGDKIIRDIDKKVESLDFRGNLKRNLSNKSRFGIQYANLVVFSEHPIIGVGYGQQSFHTRFHYPLWAKKDNYEFGLIYLNKNNPMFAPGYNIYLRLMTETGIIGLMIFVYFLYSIIKACRKIMRTTLDESKILALILLVTFVGFLLNWFQTDTFRLYGFWICLAILIKLRFNANTKLNEE